MSTDTSKHTQLTTILKQLEETGEVSRNWCLRSYITRLGSRIWDLKQEGYEFAVERRGGDYVYRLILDPRKQPTQLMLPEYAPHGW